MGVISKDNRPGTKPDRNLALELVRVTEAAALAAARWVGRGDKEAADGAAVDAMRLLINTVAMDGIVVIGEGEKDEAPMLFNGEEIGDGSPPRVDIAVDPLEGTRLFAQGRPNLGHAGGALGGQQGAHAHRGAPKDVVDVLGLGQAPELRHPAELEIHEACLVQQLLAALGRAEREEVGAIGDRDVQLAKRADRAHQRAHRHGSLRPVPDRECEAPADGEHPPGLARRGARIR